MFAFLWQRPKKSYFTWRIRAPWSLHNRSRLNQGASTGSYLVAQSVSLVPRCSGTLAFKEGLSQYSHTAVLCCLSNKEAGRPASHRAKHQASTSQPTCRGLSAWAFQEQDRLDCRRMIGPECCSWRQLLIGRNLSREHGHLYQKQYCQASNLWKWCHVYGGLRELEGPQQDRFAPYPP